MPDFVDPIETLNKLKLKPEMTACDFGCGSGGWTIPLAEILNKGKVYAIDILEEPLAVLESRAKLKNLINLAFIRDDVENENGLNILNSSSDLVLMTNLLFEAENKEQIFKEAVRILKKDGRILIVDWEPEARMGPKESRISKEEVRKIAEKFNLKLEQEFKAGDYHYGLIFKKQ